jgi:hypothetical protein
MKTKILSIVTILLVVFSVSSKTFAANKNNDSATILTDVANINKIEIHGNVQLYVTTGETDKVKVYGDYYGQNALVQEQNGVLRISSYKTEKLVVWVTVNDLREISAYDNATVESFGKLSSLELNVSLNDKASAILDVDCINTNIALNDKTTADISGHSAENYMLVNQSATANTSNFVADKSIEKTVVPVTITKEILEEVAAN